MSFVPESTVRERAKNPNELDCSLGEILKHTPRIRIVKRLGQSGIALEVDLQQGQIPGPRQFPGQPGFADLAGTSQDQRLA